MRGRIGNSILALAVTAVALLAGLAGAPARTHAGQPLSPDDLLLSLSDLPDGWAVSTSGLDSGFDFCPATDTATPILTDARLFRQTGVQLADTLLHAYALFEAGGGPAAMTEVRDLLSACAAFAGPTGDTGPSGLPVLRTIAPVAWEPLGDEVVAWRFLETGGYANSESLVIFLRRGDALAALEYRVQRFGKTNPDMELIRALARIAAERLAGLGTER